jgi:LuxR family quorum-sensing system transcriptional regulator SolR
MYQTYISALADSTSLADICKIGNNLRIQYGFDYSAYTLKIPLSVMAPQYLVMESNRMCNSQTALRKRKTPPFLERPIDANTPINWNRWGKSDDDNIVAKSLLAGGAEQGYRNGLTIPLHSHNSGSALFTCSTRRHGEEVTEEIESLIPELHLIASYLHHAVGRHVDYSRYSMVTGRISKRERECLQWTTEGLTTADIARLLNISESTVTFHVQNAMIKLDASNRQQAIARAIMLGLL